MRRGSLLRRCGAWVGAATCFTAVVAAALYTLHGRWVDTAVLMLAGLGQVTAFLWFRTAGARAACSLTLLVAALSAAGQLYSRIWWWDLLIHFLVLHVLVWLVWNRVLCSRAEARRTHAGPRWEQVLLCALVGLTVATVWEVMELLGFLLVTPEIHIPPLDTLTDVGVGVLGAALAGMHREVR